MVNPVTIAATPAVSRRAIAVIQAILCASRSRFGQTVFGPDNTIAAAPDGNVTLMGMVPPPALNVASPEYCAATKNVPAPPNSYNGTLTVAVCFPPVALSVTEPTPILPRMLKLTVPVG